MRQHILVGVISGLMAFQVSQNAFAVNGAQNGVSSTAAATERSNGVNGANGAAAVGAVTTNGVKSGDIAPVATTTSASVNSVDMANERDKLSYVLGADIGQNFKHHQIDLNTSALIKGIQDGFAGSALLVSREEMERTLQAFQKQFHEGQAKKMKEMAEENKKSGEAFMAENKGKSGVVALPSGLQYKVITAGTGPKPTVNDRVTVEYTGKLVNGKIFDSTERMGRPVTFKVSDVIPGWTEVLQLMNEGSVWEVYIPSNLAYGEEGVGGVIGPNETLIFNINLLSVKKSDTQSHQQNKAPAERERRSSKTAT